MALSDSDASAGFLFFNWAGIPGRGNQRKINKTKQFLMFGIGALDRMFNRSIIEVVYLKGHIIKISNR